jgi:hypothetical protein
MQAINIQRITKNHYHDSALMTAAHIMIGLTREGKSIEQIASDDFDDNMELVTVWADYMTALDWIHNNDGVNNKNGWIATYNGKKWVEKITNPYLHNDM